MLNMLIDELLIYCRGKLNTEMTEEDRKKLLLDRQALHASELSFVCPFTKRKILFKAPLPDDLSGLYCRCTGAII